MACTRPSLSLIHISASDVRIYQEQDDGRTVYEGEAYYNHTEYEFEISSNGEFLKWGEDHKD